MSLKKKNLTGAKFHDNVYTANVTLEPRVSRFEIYGFQYTQEGDVPKYTSVKLQKIALNITIHSLISCLNFLWRILKYLKLSNHTEVWGWI